MVDLLAAYVLHKNTTQTETNKDSPTSPKWLCYVQSRIMLLRVTYTEVGQAMRMHRRAMSGGQVLIRPQCTQAETG